MEQVRVVVAHDERTTLRVGDVFLKVDGDDERLDAEVEALAAAPVPTPRVLWRRPHVLALAAVRGTPLGRVGEPSTASPAAWRAAGAVVRTLHDAPLPTRMAPGIDARARRLERESAWLVEHDVLPAGLVAHNRALAETALRPAPPVFAHGDLQADHVFVVDDAVAGIIDWSEAARDDAAFDLALLTLGHAERLDDVLDGYGSEVDQDRIRAWWSWRCLVGVRWLVEHGFDPFAPGCEVDVLRAQP
ncbi:phosphotransferase [Cellulomonas massiliensis]|uniref:phosphotransferase n=1 Tax=Cellulomonas massiliensis TaxID=1465811 RepID=UPI0002FADA6A|nr:phosphotransferase [Cellulomonas massiliensis]